MYLCPRVRPMTSRFHSEGTEKLTSSSPEPPLLLRWPSLKEKIVERSMKSPTDFFLFAPRFCPLSSVKANLCFSQPLTCFRCKGKTGERVFFVFVWVSTFHLPLVSTGSCCVCRTPPRRWWGDPWPCRRLVARRRTDFVECIQWSPIISGAGISWGPSKVAEVQHVEDILSTTCLLYTSPSPRD